MTRTGSDHCPEDRFAREAAAALPPVRDDEPASLRQDILDELSDHLACAFRRELLRTNGDETRAEGNVRRSFGDPARIARRLWFDAMRSRLMVQKVLVGTCAILVGACIVFGVLLWRTVGEMRETNAAMVRQSQEANASLIDENRRTHLALLERLRAIENRPVIPATDPEWNPVTVRLVTGAKGGPPAAGMVAVLRRQEAGDQFGVTAVASQDGVIDFGLQQPGPYVLAVQTPWQENALREIRIKPGHRLDLTVVCPAGPPASVPAQWTVDWPANLDVAGEQAWCVALVSGKLNRTFDGDEWSLPAADRRVFAFHPDGRTIELTSVGESFDPPADLLRRSVAIQKLFPNHAFEMGLRPTDPGHVWAGAAYEVLELGLAKWDGQGSQLELLTDVEPAVRFEQIDQLNPISGGTIGNVFHLSGEAPTFIAPLEGIAAWRFKVPSGLVTLADRLWAAQAKGSDLVREGRFSFESLRELFPPEPPPPVEAPRPRIYVPLVSSDGFVPPFMGIDGRPLVTPSAVPVSFSCMGERGVPLPDVHVQLSRVDPTPGSPFYNDGFNDVRTTAWDGLADFGLREPGRYHLSLTTPWHEHASGPITVVSKIVQQPIECPASLPPRLKARYSPVWPNPSLGREHPDLWLVAELVGEATRSVGGRNWRGTDSFLVALHPDGRVIEWRKRPEVDHVGYRSLTGLPDLLSKFEAKQRASEVLAGGVYRLLGIGVARWDGTGDPSQLLAGLRDGRYESRPRNPARGAFFHVLRHIAPMKSVSKLSPVGILGVDEGTAIGVIGFDVPESLVNAALRRWEKVPVAVKRKAKGRPGK